jgi:prepilin-type N-terminal cleavage/methylation domain-containing protein
MSALQVAGYTMQVRRRTGFTLVELLVVIAIIGILVALLLPAIQSARAAARRTTCSNNIRQLSLACMNHESAHGHLPTGGWGWRWFADPNRGFGKDQPGGWCFNVLPYAEEETLYDSANGATDAERRANSARLAATPVGIFTCPSRRAPQVYPHTGTVYFNINNPAGAGRGDYAANAGDAGDNDPEDLNPDGVRNETGPASYAAAATHVWRDSWHRGVCYQRSKIKIGDIIDGTSKTYLLGERYLMPQNYSSGADPGDDQNLWIGHDRDIIRWTDQPPRRDTEGLSYQWAFGSAHTNGCFFSFCDGAVRFIAYDIDPTTHQRLGNRQDRQSINLPD